MFKRVFLFCLILFVLLFMGMWQVQRFFYKESLIASFEQSSEQAFVVSGAKEIPENVNHRIQVEGSFIPGKTIFWYKLQKNKMGYHLVVPFQLERGVILVDLGWSQTKQEVNVRKGKYILSGYLLNFYGPSKFVVNNDIKGRTWFRLDKDEIDKYLGYNIIPFILKVENKNHLVGEYDFVPKKIINNHLYYAVMWFALGIIWSVLMMIYTKVYKSVGEEK